jgi:uncharacterized protein (TIGR02246 family)
MRAVSTNCSQLLAILTVVLALPGAALAETDAVQRLLDRVEIEEMMMRYTHALDDLDADAFVSVFTPDGVFELPGGDFRRGHDGLRTIVTERLDQERDAASLEHHVVTNSTLEFVADDEVRHVGYWLTIIGDMQNGFTVPAMGHYEDLIVKRDGKWLFESRKVVLPGMP